MEMLLQEIQVHHFVKKDDPSLEHWMPNGFHNDLYSFHKEYLLLSIQSFLPKGSGLIFYQCQL